jgi:hypothetical protein
MKSSVFWVSEEYVASSFRVEEEAKQETSVKAGGFHVLQYRIFNAEVGDVYRPDCALTL